MVFVSRSSVGGLQSRRLRSGILGDPLNAICLTRARSREPAETQRSLQPPETRQTGGDEETQTGATARAFPLGAAGLLCEHFDQSRGM
jgi:hypothetical protein